MLKKLLHHFASRRSLHSARRYHSARCSIHRFLLCALLLFPFVFSLSTSHAASDEQLAVFDDAWATIRDRYYDADFHGVDWQAQREQFRPLAAEAGSAKELYTILRRMIGNLHDAHTRIYAPDEKFDWQHPRSIGIGVALREVEGLPVVIAVDRGSEAERAGLRAGDVIETIDDAPALAVFAERLEEQHGSSTVAAARLHAMATLFEGALNSTIKITLRGRDERERIVALHREWRERNTALRLRRVRGGYAVIAFDAFTPASTLDVLRALANKLRDARGLVIDLRNNGGGDAEAMTEIASAFLPLGKSLGRFTNRDASITLEPQTRNAMLFASDAITHFQSPLVILTSERTSSAAEIFVAALKEAKRATVIGTQTCGCVLAISRPHALPDGGELDISEMDYRTAAGTRLEGIGIMPDEKIALDRRDLRAGRDRALERALMLLESERGNEAHRKSVTVNASYK
jgi:carboxyl-terminal processing protease